MDLKQNEYLVAFWELALNEDNNRYQLLKVASKLRWHDKRLPRTQLKSLRWQFVTNHVCRKRYPMSDKCFLHPEYDNGQQLVRHHVLSLKNWGCNRRINIVTLCERCHAYMHPYIRK